MIINDKWARQFQIRSGHPQGWRIRNWAMLVGHATVFCHLMTARAISALIYLLSTVLPYVILFSISFLIWLHCYWFQAPVLGRNPTFISVLFRSELALPELLTDFLKTNSEKSLKFDPQHTVWGGNSWTCYRNFRRLIRTSYNFSKDELRAELEIGPSNTPRRIRLYSCSDIYDDHLCSVVSKISVPGWNTSYSYWSLEPSVFNWDQESWLTLAATAER